MLAMFEVYFFKDELKGVFNRTLSSETSCRTFCSDFGPFYSKG